MPRMAWEVLELPQVEDCQDRVSAAPLFTEVKVTTVVKAKRSAVARVEVSLLL